MRRCACISSIYRKKFFLCLSDECRTSTECIRNGLASAFYGSCHCVLVWVLVYGVYHIIHIHFAQMLLERFHIALKTVFTDGNNSPWHSTISGTTTAHKHIQRQETKLDEFESARALPKQINRWRYQTVWWYLIPTRNLQIKQCGILVRQQISWTKQKMNFKNVSVVCKWTKIHRLLTNKLFWESCNENFTHLQ